MCVKCSGLSFVSAVGLDGMEAVINAVKKLLGRGVVMNDLSSATPSSIVDMLDQETVTRARAWYSEDKDIVAQNLHRMMKDCCPPETEISITSGRSLAGTLSHSQPDLGCRVFLGGIKSLIPHHAKEIVDDAARSFSIPWEYINCELLHRFRVCHVEERIRTLRELGLNVTAEEEELEKHLRNKRLIENKIIPELKRRDAANKTTVMNPLHPGSASASTDNVDSMTKL